MTKPKSLIARLKQYMVTRYEPISERFSSMERHEAEEIYDQGKEVVVKKLLDLDDEIKVLKEKMTQLDQNSQNSSRPPSADPHNQRVQRKKKQKKSGRKAGGQPGHKGKKRALVPPEQVDEFIDHYPETCSLCGLSLPENVSVAEPVRYQQVEIPEIKPTITEHRLHATGCTCGMVTRANLPPGVAASHFGPRLTAIIAYLTVILHAPRRSVEEFCSSILGVHLSHGSVCNLLTHVSVALEKTVEQLRLQLPSQPVLYVDETGWYGRWLWIFVSSSFVYFHIGTSRGSRVLIDVLGKTFAGILCVDRWGAYAKYHKGLMQYCWAHLKRNFQRMSDVGETTKSLATQEFAGTMQSYRRKLMTLWSRFKEGQISQDRLAVEAESIKLSLKYHLERFIDCRVKKVRRLSRNLYKQIDHLFTFCSAEVEPTNNNSERGLRPAVQWRKICFGNKSDHGALMAARLLTVTRTCQMQKRKPLEFLVKAVVAYRSSKPAPTLMMTDE